MLFCSDTTVLAGPSVTLRNQVVVTTTKCMPSHFTFSRSEKIAPNGDSGGGDLRNECLFLAIMHSTVTMTTPGSICTPPESCTYEVDSDDLVELRTEENPLELSRGQEICGAYCSTSPRLASDA